MVEALTDLDRLLLARWGDAVGIWTAIEELERRLGGRLETVAEDLRPWFEANGYHLLEVNRKHASVEIAKQAWLKTKDDEPWIHVAVGALYPCGYWGVDEEHPYVWVYSSGMERDEQELFRTNLAARLKNRSVEWVNEDCSRASPIGKYIESHGDAERVQLAQSTEALAAFIKLAFESVFKLGADLDAALQTVKES